MGDAGNGLGKVAGKELSYGDFGQKFVHMLVTPARIERELRALLAEPLQGRVSRLPAELITARYTFNLQDVSITTRPELLPQLALRQRITGSIRLKVNVLTLSFGFTLRVVINLEQIVRTYEPLLLKLETHLLDDDSIELGVDPHDIPSDILDRLNLIEGAVREEIVDEVNKRIASGPISQALSIDLKRIAEEARLTSSG